MNTVVAFRLSDRSARDPVLVAIDGYLAAIKNWRAADRRIKQLKKKLPADLMREPRVQVGVLRRGADSKTGEDIKEPIYVYSELELEHQNKRDCKQWLSFRAPLPASPAGRKLRCDIRVRYKARFKENLAALRADKDDLYARPRAAGWRQAVEAEENSLDLVYKMNYRLQITKPTTLAGAIALLELVYATTITERRAHGRHPYGLSEHCMARIARHVAGFLKSQSRGRDGLKRAA